MSRCWVLIYSHHSEILQGKKWEEILDDHFEEIKGVKTFQKTTPPRIFFLWCGLKIPLPICPPIHNFMIVSIDFLIEIGVYRSYPILTDMFIRRVCNLNSDLRNEHDSYGERHKIYTRIKNALAFLKKWSVGRVPITEYISIILVTKGRFIANSVVICKWYSGNFHFHLISTMEVTLVST